VCRYSKFQHSFYNWWKLVEKCESSISFLKFKMAAATMLDSGHQEFFDNMCCYSKWQHHCQNWWKLVEKCENGISFSKFKMAAVAMLDAGYLTVYDIIDVLSFKVVTFLLNLVKFGQKNERRASIFLNSRWRQPPPGVFLIAYICCNSESQHSQQFWWNVVNNAITALSCFWIQDGCGRHFEKYTSGSLNIFASATRIQRPGHFYR